MKLILPNLAPGWTTSTRRTRLALTFALCIPGAVHLLVADLYESGRAWQWTLMSLLLRIFILHPLLEYWGHWLIHEVSNVQHANHHSEIKHNSAGADEFEFWCYLMAVAAYHSSYTRGACIGFLSVAANSNPTTIGILSRRLTSARRRLAARTLGPTSCRTTGRRSSHTPRATTPSTTSRRART